MQTVFDSAVTTRQSAPPPKFTKRIGSTSYLVSVHFSKASAETITDKILRLLEREGKKTA